VPEGVISVVLMRLLRMTTSLRTPRGNMRTDNKQRMLLTLLIAFRKCHTFLEHEGIAEQNPVWTRNEFLFVPVENWLT
jgi:hypothetical protein